MREIDPFKTRFERERLARKEAETLLEKKSLELYQANQQLEQRVSERTVELMDLNQQLKKQVAERKRFSEALELSEARLAGILDIANAAIVSVDKDQRVILFNRTAEEIFGHKSEEVTCKDLSILIPSRHRAGHKKSVEEFGKSGHTFRGMGESRVVTGLRKDGSEFPAQASISCLRLGAETIFTVVLSDISERIKAEQELVEAKEAAETATMAKSEFLANMSHEIRTPMNAVIGMTSLLIESGLEPEQRDYAEVIRTSGETLLTVINEILDLSKIESGKVELEVQSFELPARIEEAVGLLYQKARSKGLFLGCSFHDGIPRWVFGDPTRLFQIFVNLIDNAIKFTEHGFVEFIVRQEPLNGTEQVPTSLQDFPGGVCEGLRKLHFVVRDTGVGIPPERMNRLFKPFSQVDASTTRTHGGTGLGLVISREMARLMGGDMWVESEPGKGASFHFTILTAIDPSRPQGVLRPELKGKKCLLIGDDDVMRGLLSRLASFLGLDVTVEESQSNALRNLGTRAFDFILLSMDDSASEITKLVQSIKDTAGDGPPKVVLARSRPGPVEGSLKELFDGMLSAPFKERQLALAFVEGTGGVSGEKKGKTQEHLSKASGRESRRLSILIAEDNVINQKVVTVMLQKEGYRADLAANGLEVLQALELRDYDVILMDVQMPELDGLEATKRLRARLPQERQPHIIALTANALESDRQRCIEAGMNDYISKPVRKAELIEALERVPIPQAQCQRRSQKTQ